MLNDEDIKRLSSLLATKEDIEAMKAQTLALRDEAVHNLAGTIEETFTEIGESWNGKEATLHARLDEQERWIRKIAERLDIDLAE